MARLTAGTAGELWAAEREQCQAVCMQPSRAVATADSLPYRHQSLSMTSPDSLAWNASASYQTTVIIGVNFCYVLLLLLLHRLTASFQDNLGKLVPQR